MDLSHRFLAVHDTGASNLNSTGSNPLDKERELKKSPMEWNKSIFFLLKTREEVDYVYMQYSVFDFFH